MVHGAERDHRAVEGEVLVGQPAQVAQQRGLAAVLGEHRVGEVRLGAQQLVGQGVLGGGVDGVPVLAAAPKAATTTSRWARVVVSAVLTPTVSSSTKRRSTPASAGRAHDLVGAAGTAATTVSKKSLCTR
jgi:hypothetical protein